MALALTLAALALGAVTGSAQTVGGLQFTDWTATGGTTATGTLLGNTVTLTGWHLSELPASYLDGSATFFSAPYFTPPLPHGDAIEFRAENGQPHEYTLSFSSPTTDPVLHLASLGTTLQFPSGTNITRVSGKNDGFAVSGSTIIGAGDTAVDSYGNNDSNGTVRLNGTFTSITFTATTGYAIDGVLLQVGAPVPPSITPEPTPPPPTPGPSPVPAPPALPLRTVDLRVSGIEVTQAVQASGCAGCEGTLPSRAPVVGLRGALPASTARYQGVRMVAGKFTVVRVYATFTRPTDIATLGGVTATLEVIDSNGGVTRLTPDSSPASLRRTDCWTCVTAAQRADAAGSFNFLIPWQQTLHRQLSFRATVTPKRYAHSLLPTVQCSGCHANMFTLTGVPFVQTVAVPVHPIRLTVNTPAANNVRTAMDENQVFGSAQTVLPANVQVFPYEAADLPVSDTAPPGCLTPAACGAIVTGNATAAVALRAGQDGYANTQFAIGVFQNHVGTDLLGGSTTNRLFGTGPAISIARDNRPLTSVMHEIGHGLGLAHADTGSYLPPPVNDNKGPHPDGTADCGGNSNGQVGETWLPDGSEVPPDNEGRLNSVGLDRRAWDIFRTGSLPRPIVEGFPGAGDRYFDFMSYCGAFPDDATFEAAHWISLTNWNRLLDFHAPPQTLAAAAVARVSRANAHPVRVLATVDPSGSAAIFDVSPGLRALGPPTADSPYRIELRDAAGSVIASAVPSASVIHVDDAGNGTLLDATLPFRANAASATVTRDGRELARRARSPHAPTVRLLTPRTGSRLGRAGTVRIRWRARDADQDHLLATLSYSAGGRRWHVIADRPHGSSVRVPSRALSASRHGRLRVTVNDGFNLATATAARLRAAGAPPLVRIIGAHRGSRRLAAGRTLLLQGDAFDDTGRPVTGRRLKWYAGRRLIGRGAQVTARRLAPGATNVRLEATDSHGRTSQAMLRIKVRAPKPSLTVVRAPASASAHARRIRIAVASNVPATLTITHARHTVGPRLRTITIRLRPGRSTLRFAYTLRSPGGTVRGIYVVSRRE